MLSTNDEVPRRTGGMRILMIAPPWYEIPPGGYGGIEAMLAALVGGLSRRGHEVVLVGAGRPGTSARFLPTYDLAPSERIGQAMPELLHAAKAHRMTAELEVDVVHDHSMAGPLTAAVRSAPTLATCHGEVEGELAEYYRAIGGDLSLVAISGAQRRAVPDLNWVGTVHNAVETGSFPFRADKQDWVLWLGRFSHTKGAHTAIDVARAAGRRILLAGKLVEQHEKDYFDEYVRPRLGPGAEYVGQAGDTRKRELLAAASCLLFPIAWDEPFGMVMIEAMACGTPVVALGRGAVPEVVVDGLTGFVRFEEDELPAAVDAVGGLDPHACRSHVWRKFDVEVMTEGYERIYRRMAAGRGLRLPAAADGLMLG
ncbi:glycosyltransferase family 4 protein [Planobispora siamensis]|uniref:Glycosyl transferase n=1 Tax=Planobispora siamensis TaxID=936338 RepID=A0A8J3SMX3_9ACTN|nr:glycosyltransferase family 4 protein [Planobispora siamensis]GIH92518.1 glycosyl transferase [Planobispora siamensis]